MSVTLYKNHDFGGNSVELEKGSYPTIPIGNDVLSSVVIDPGYYAYFYEHTGFRGAKLVLFEGEYDGLSKWNDKISSVQVFAQQPGLFPLVSFFLNTDFKGRKQTLSGTGDATQFNMPFFMNDEVSSVIVPEGMNITLYEHAGFKGKSLDLEAGEHPNLGFYGFNNRVSSLEIRRPGLELVSIKYLSEEMLPDGNPIAISGRVQSTSEVTQKYTVNLQRELSTSVTRSWSDSSMVGIEVSTTASVGVEKGPLSASLSTTISTRLENTFTIGEEETNSEVSVFGQTVEMNISPNHIGKATIILTPKKYRVDAVYTFRMTGIEKTIDQEVSIEVDDFHAGEALIDTYPIGGEVESV